MFTSMHLLSSETSIDLLGALWFHTKWRQKWCQVVIGLPFVLGSKDCQIGTERVSGSWCHSLYREAEGKNIIAGIISASLSWQDWHGVRYTLQGWRQYPNYSHDCDTLSALSLPGDKQSFQGDGDSWGEYSFDLHPPALVTCSAMKTAWIWKMLTAAEKTWLVPLKTQLPRKNRSSVTKPTTTHLCRERFSLQELLLWWDVAVMSQQDFKSAYINRKLVEIQPLEDMQCTIVCLSVACPYLLWTSFKVIV